jgi:DNA-binding transcriptional MocR family regulator
VAVLPGDLFYPNLDGGQHAIRLSFSNTETQRIAEGVARLERGLDAAAR